MNYQQQSAPDDHMPPGFQGQLDPAVLDPRMRLYDDYAMPQESFEAFCDRMADDFGSNWVNKF
jgi:hypothetical protein